MVKKKFLEEIKRLYKIKQILGIKKLSGGRINHPYEINTKKGNFILKILNPQEINFQRLKEEFELMNILKKRKFPYEINAPIKNIFNNQLSLIDDKRVYLYKKIDGEMINKYHIKPKHIKELAKALAIYHKFVKNIRLSVKKEAIKRTLTEYKKLKLMKKTRVQKELMKDYNFFFKLLKEVINHYPDKNKLIIHGDFSPKNIIFKKDKVNGIIDFEVIRFAPRISDLKYVIKDISYNKNKFDKNRYWLFINEYNKWNKLTKEEIKKLPFMILLDECEAYLWVIKNLKNKGDIIYCKKIIKRTKTTIKTFHDKFKNSKIIGLI